MLFRSERAKAIDIGQKYLEREARRLGVQMARISKSEFESIAGEYGCSKMEDLHAALGYGKFSARQVLQKLVPEKAPAEAPEAPQPAPAPRLVPGVTADDRDLVIKVKGVDDVLIYRAKCCNPIRGEPIVGYVTRGKGIAVHAVNCANVQNLMYEAERKIDVEWARGAAQTFQVKMLVYTQDRPGMLNQLTSVLANEQTNIRSLEARSDDERATDGAIVDMTVEVKDTRQLERVVSAMRRISGVRDIERVNQ